MSEQNTATRTELRRVAEEFKSERDAAKRDAMRAFDERNIALADHERTRALYEELLYAVARKYPGETRHQTALRYIRQREQEPNGDTGSSTPVYISGDGQSETST